MKECYCCQRREARHCSCEGPTCRSCLKCENVHCECLSRPIEQTLARAAAKARAGVLELDDEDGPFAGFPRLSDCGE
jgi:hypothetical protein